MKRTAKIAEFSLFTALAFVFSYLESLIPLPLPFPGMKLGLANLVILIFLVRRGFRCALGLSLFRNLLVSLTFGNLFALAYSMAGSLLSLTAMELMRKYGSRDFSLISVSALGGILHNMGQLFVASLIIGPGSILWYLPILYFCGMITGLLIGFLSEQCIRRLPDFPKQL